MPRIYPDNPSPLAGLSLPQKELLYQQASQLISDNKRDLFDRLDLLPDWEVRYHDIDAPSEAALLMQIKHRLHGTRNEPVNVLLDGSTLLEGETAIREKLALP